MTSESLLSIKALHKTFHQDIFAKPQKVIQNISCDFPREKCIGFMGHNGAGKTTTIKTIFGLLKPDRGEILFKGRPIQREDKANIGYMPELNKLPSNLNSFEVLMNHLKIYRPTGVPKKKYHELVKEKLVEVDLWDHRHKRVSKLSKGMGRRLSWSQATIHDPDLVILDEPFSGLDPLGRQLMFELIHKIRKAKKTVILCTHELWSINAVCDELHILREGRLAYSTVNPVSGQLPKPLFNYRLEASGLSKQSILDLKETLNLPDWDYLDDTDYLFRLGFDEYVDASKWVRAFVEKGIILISFSRQKGFIEKDLEKYFMQSKG